MRTTMNTMTLMCHLAMGGGLFLFFLFFCHNDSFDGYAAEHSDEENVVDDAAIPGYLIAVPEVAINLLLRPNGQQ